MTEMNCKDCAVWLQAYLDNELDAQKAIDVRQHLESCADCRASAEAALVLGKALRKLPYETAPASLKQRVLAQLPQAPSAQQRRSQPWLLPVFSTFALAMAAWLYVSVPVAGSLSDELIADHVRSLQEQHLTDVASSDRHTVKPWFAGKLDYAPPVYDFAAQDYPLIGGRLDYLDHRTVAALSYRRNKHIINVFIRPAEGDDSPVKTLSVRGYNIVSWRQNHMEFDAVSDLNGKELAALAALIANAK